MNQEFYFSGFKVEYNPASGQVTTWYEDYTHCPVKVNKDHAYHAGLIGITPQKFNLLHELGHHLLSIAFGNATCPIVWASAHGQPMPAGADLLEWKITALTYLAVRKMYEANMFGALLDIANAEIDPFRVAQQLYDLVFTPQPTLYVENHQ